MTPTSWRRAWVALATGVVLLLASPAYAVPGDLDTTFGGGDGKVATNYTSDNDLGLSVAIQADGKIVVAGRAGGAGGQFAVIRYNPDGTLDTTFSGDGKVATNFTGGDDLAHGVALQADGKIVVAGRAGGSNPRFALARYNADGTLDTTFDFDGRLLTDFSSGRDVAWDVALQSDGKIVAAGYAGGGGGRFALARYNSDGTLDTGFHEDGRLFTNFTARFDAATAVAVQTDGKIVAAGSASDDDFFALARYSSDGMLDTTFEGDGTVVTDFTAGFDFSWDLALQTDGKLVIVGRAGGTWGMARYDVNGVLDPTFSTDGKVRTDFSRRIDAASGVAIQPDGKLVVVGSGNEGRVVGVARYGVDGALDGTFSGNGKLTTDLTSGFDFAWEVALQTDGKIVAAGRADGRGGRFAVVRYLGT